MTIAAIGSNPQQTLAAALDPSQPSGALQLLANNYNSLGQALDAGNLPGAQQAFTALISGVSSSGSATTASTGPSSGPGSSVGADLVSLGQALQAGNLPAAQQAFSGLQQAVASVGGAGGSSSAGANSSAGASSASASTTITNQVTIPNSDGTITVVITYANGSTQTTTQAGPGGSSGSSGSGPTNLLA